MIERSKINQIEFVGEFFLNDLNSLGNRTYINI